MSDPAVRLEGVEKVHGLGDRAVHALRGIDLTVDAGETVAIVGPSGSGKSTLLHLLGALDVPTRGRVLLEGTDLAALDDEGRAMLRRRRIGFVFQFFHLLPTLSALENVLLPSILDGRVDADREKTAAGLLERVGLGARAVARPGELSGGQMQRVAIARALAHGPAVLLADEPTGNLDRKTGREVLALLGELVRAHGTTLLVVTHDPEAAAAMGRTVTLVDGRLST